MRKILLFVLVLVAAGPLRATDPRGEVPQLPNLFVLEDPSILLSIPAAEAVNKSLLECLGQAVNGLNALERKFSQSNFSNSGDNSPAQSQLEAARYLELCQELKRANLEFSGQLLGLFLSSALGTTLQRGLRLEAPLELYHTKQHWLASLTDRLSPSLQEWLARAVPQLAAWEPHPRYLRLMNRLLGGLVPLSASTDDGQEAEQRDMAVEEQQRDLTVEILRRLLTARLIWEEYFSCLSLLLAAPFRQPDHGYRPELVKMYEIGIVQLVEQIINVGKVYHRLGSRLKEQISAVRLKIGTEFFSKLIACVRLLEGPTEAHVTSHKVEKAFTIGSLTGLDPRLVAEIVSLVDLVESIQLSETLKALSVPKRRLLNRRQRPEEQLLFANALPCQKRACAGVKN